MSVDRLPNELLLKIFSDVSPIDLADCARVCIRWRDLIRWQIFDRKPVTKGRAKKCTHSSYGSCADRDFT